MRFILSVSKNKPTLTGSRLHKFLYLIGVKDLPPNKLHVKKTNIKFKLEK